MASFVSLEKQRQPAMKMLNIQTMCSSIFGRKQQALTVYYELEWSALVLFLITTLAGDVASGMKWLPLRKFPHILYSVSLQNKLCIWFHSSQGRGTWILTLVPPRYEASASIMKKKFLAKIICWGISGSLADLHMSFDCPGPSASLQVCLNLPILRTFLWLRSWIRH